MRRRARLALALALHAAGAGPALAEAASLAAPPEAPRGAEVAARGGSQNGRMAVAVSRRRFSIDAAWSGAELFVFGALKTPPSPGAGADVVISVTGPPAPAVVRLKERRFGLWVSGESRAFPAAPVFYARAATSGELGPAAAAQPLPAGLDLAPGAPEAGAAAFRAALVRRRHAQGLYAAATGPVELLEDALFLSSVALPANILPGDYTVDVALLDGGEVVDRYRTRLEVRQAGVEGWLADLARDRPLAYGLLAVAVAMAAGWGADRAARLLRP